MDREKASRVTFLVILLAIFGLALWIAVPYLTHIVLAFVLAYVFRPVYRWLVKITKRPGLSSGVLVLFILILVILPLLFLLSSLAIQMGNVIVSFSREGSVGSVYLDTASATMQEWFGIEFDLAHYTVNLVQRGLLYLVETEGLNIVRSVSQGIIGMFVMFFILYYLFKGGSELVEDIKELVPLKKHYKARLFSETGSMVHAVLYGQVLTAIVQGSLGGLGMIAAGIPNALFWTFVMILFSFIPVTGTPLIFVPAGLYLFSVGHTTTAIIFFIYSFVIVMNVDNFLKPRLIGTRSRVHPTVILVGVLGGLRLFGFIGIILGPLIMAMLLVLIRFYVSDFVKEQPATVEP
ncbi:MAG: AI-2E family transporter [Nanoarchaeota archaeon]